MNCRLRTHSSLEEELSIRWSANRVAAARTRRSIWNQHASELTLQDFLSGAISVIGFGLAGLVSGATSVTTSGATSVMGLGLAGRVSGATSVTGFGVGFEGELSGATSVIGFGLAGLVSGATSVTTSGLGL